MIFTEEKSFKRSFTAIIITEAAAIAIIVSGAAAVKYFSPETGKKISRFYLEKICEKTKSEDVLKYFKDEI